MRSARLLCIAGVVSLAACGGDDGNGVTGPSSGVTELQVVDIRAGTGDQAVVGSVAVVDYAGWLYATGAPDNKGALFDTSVGRQPFSFVVGAGQVIQGWDQGVPGMRVGGVRRLVIPPDLAYGSRGQGSIPPNATLVFEVELLEVR
jgi:FKBP-type peptidyl-prolyl cis-trans isomerase FkpA